MPNNISDRWLKKGIEEYRCPICHVKLIEWGKTTDYNIKTMTIEYVCPKCWYKRHKLSKME